MKPRLLLFDAGAVMEAMRLGVWEVLCDQYTVLVPSIVIHSEVQFYVTKNGAKEYVDLQGWVADGRLEEVEASLNEIEALRRRFDIPMRQGLHEGESEALAYMIAHSDKEIYFVTGDGPAWRALAMLGMAEWGISLAAACAKCGRTVKAERPFTEEFRDHHCTEGSLRIVTRVGFAPDTH
ncbi:MAG: hypothetical protein ACYC2K_13845 [Gemmatimonadales bacterium]